MLYRKTMCLERSLRIFEKSCFVVYHKDFSRPISVHKYMYTHAHTHTNTHTLKSELVPCWATRPFPVSHSGRQDCSPDLNLRARLNSWDPVLKGSLSGSDSLSVLDVILVYGLYS